MQRELSQGFFLKGGILKIGITTPRGCGNAVQRNRTKRIMRETFRKNQEKFPADGAIIYLVMKHGDWEEIMPEMLELARRVSEIAYPSPQSELN